MPPRMGNGERPKNGKNSLKNVAHVLKPFKLYFILTIICILVAVLTAIIAPRLTSELTSGVIRNGATFITQKNMGLDVAFNDMLEFKILNFDINMTIFNLGISILIVYVVGLLFGYFAELISLLNLYF